MMHVFQWAGAAGARPSLLQQWVRERINYLKASCLSTACPVDKYEIKLMALIYPFYYQLLFLFSS